MAGRGTDIQLGGNLDMRVLQELEGVEDAKERERRTEVITREIGDRRKVVLDAGGLFVLGTERHESRRVDNQLRGRSGRQGDPGASKFFVGLEDDLMRIFGSERMDSMLGKLGLQEGEAIVHPWVNKALEKAQQKVEARNFEIRKQLLRFDNVMNDQRKVIYEQRREIMSSDDLSAMIVDMRHEALDDMVARTIPENALPEQWDAKALHEECLRLLALDLPVEDWAKEEGIADQEIRERLQQASDRKMAEKAANYGPEMMRMAEKSLLLQLLDQIWKDHLLTLDHLRQGVGLRGYAQRDPLIEYKSEAFNLFQDMLVRLRENVTGLLSHVELRMEAPPEPPPQPTGVYQELHDEIDMFDEPEEAEALPATGTNGVPAAPRRARPARRGPRAMTAETAPPGWVKSEATGGWVDPHDTATWGKVPRNAVCPCGSGKKYKHCHGAV